METETIPLRGLDNYSDRLQWRMAWLYKEIAALCANEKGYCWAHSSHFIERWRQFQERMKDSEHADFNLSVATVRRWISNLVACGWIRAEVAGPNRRLYLAVHPSQVLSAFPALVKRLFAGSFKRLLTGVLSGLSPVSSICKQMRSSKRTSAQEGQTAPTEETVSLSPAETVAVEALIQNGIKPERCAIDLVKRCGLQRVEEQLEALPYRKTPILTSKAGLLRKSIEQGYSLPEGLIAARERAAQAVKEQERAKTLRRQEEARREAAREQARIEEARREEAKREREAAADPTLLPQWEQAKAVLSAILSRPFYSVHVATAIPVRLVEGCLTLRASNPFSREQLERRHDQVTAAVSEAIGQAVQVKFE